MTAHTTRICAKPKTRHLLMCCTALVALPYGAQAQDTTDGDGEIYRLAPITVYSNNDAGSVVASEVSTGSKMPTDVLDNAATVSVVTQKEIERRAASTTEQVLQYTAGVVTDFYGSDDRYDFYMIRGFDAYAYRDGLLLGAPFGGVREEPFAYERVEVLKGANSTGFGVADPGGAVNYISKIADGERLRETYLTYGSFDHKEVGFDFGDRFDEAGTLSWRLTGKIQDAAAETDYSNDDETFLMGSLTWKLSDASSVSLIVDYLNRDGYANSGGYPIGYDFDRSDFFGEPDFNYLDTDRKTVTLMLGHDFGAGLSTSSSLRYSKTDNGFGYFYVNSAYDTDPSDTTIPRAAFANETASEDIILDANLLYERDFGTISSRSLLGFEARHTNTNTKNYYADGSVLYPYPDDLDLDWSDPNYLGDVELSDIPIYTQVTLETDTKAIYAQQELTFNDRFIANLGLRHDWIDVTQDTIYYILGTEIPQTIEEEYSETTARLGLTYKVNPNLSLYGSYAESVVPATDTFGSLQPDPERGKQYEFGVKYRPEGMRALFSASVFDLTKYNMTVTNPITLQPETVGESRVKGIELEAKAEVSDALNLTAAYAYLDSEIVENGNGGNEGNKLMFVPDHSASVWVDYMLAGTGSRGDLGLGLGARYTGAYWMTNGNTSPADSAVIYDAAVSYELSEETELALNVSNLFDEKHIVYGGTTGQGYSGTYYNPGREISLTLRKTW